MIDPTLHGRLLDYAGKWSVVIEKTFETESSVIGFGSRGSGAREGRPVVLKVIRREGDEWRSGEILQAFNGNGCARAYEHAPGAVLLERLRPGNSLAEMALTGRDAEATDILVDVIQQMSIQSRSARQTLVAAGVTVCDLAKAFDRYLATRDRRIPKQLIESAHCRYLSLIASQREPLLLHGDLHHYNVLFDLERGWLAIDPKGIIGEAEYEIGSILRNPIELPELFTSPATIQKRTKRFTKKLNLDYERVLGWAFAQAVLSAIWHIEDGFPVDAMNPALRLAIAIQAMLPGTARAQS